MKTYVVKVFGWMTIIDAENKKDAVRSAKAMAPAVSLLGRDVTASHVRRATEKDTAWFEAMSGGARAPKEQS